MKTYVILMLSLLGSMWFLNAHNPLSARYYLEVKEGFGILNINLSQNGLHETLKKHYPEINLENISEIDYKQLAVNYIKEHFNLQINGKNIQLLDGGIKLGNHQTDMKFVTNELPISFENLDVLIEAFSENDQHQSIFSLLLNGVTSKIILSKTNNYSASVNFENDAMVGGSKSFNKNYLWCLMLLPLLFFGKNIFRKAS